ncbi:hypothetical protein F2Q68_00040958 [Brassica cretica]|uniref:Uncharacterized protein n=1 Tax=Brassica cretica TaxID=69181 RepID=A0A8S9MHX5_BRACR|nr:hypothetical protein F2Q68_00040958 [Brassica cretica]
MESTSRGGETYEEASKRDRINSQEKKENYWTFFAAAAQVYGGMIQKLVESVEMISSYEIRWQAVSIRKKGFRAVLELQSEGLCDYMHWSLGFLHVLQVIGTESIVEHKGSVSHGILGTRERLRTLNDMNVSWLFRWMKTCMFQVFCMGFSSSLFWLLRAYEGGNKWVYRVSRLHRIESKGFWFEAVVIQVLQELQVASEKADGIRLWYTTTASETKEETFTEDDLKARGGFRLVKS